MLHKGKVFIYSLILFKKTRYKQYWYLIHCRYRDKHEQFVFNNGCSILTDMKWQLPPGKRRSCSSMKNDNRHVNLYMHSQIFQRVFVLTNNYLVQFTPLTTIAWVFTLDISIFALIYFIKIYSIRISENLPVSDSILSQTKIIEKL